MRKLFRVTTKAAIYSKDLSKVLAINISRHAQEIHNDPTLNNNYGLPGGHIEKDESPDIAIARELYEECGIKNIKLKKVDFFIHSNGKVVLAYTGILRNDVTVASTQDIKEGTPTWLNKNELEAADIEVNYRRLVLENWPS